MTTCGHNAGYVDTALHQAARPDAEFQFVNIAQLRTFTYSAAGNYAPSHALI